MADADWVLEAIVEQLEPKRELLARVEQALAGRERAPIVTTNTSGLSIGALVAERSDPFRRRFCGTHFFNPPRYPVCSSSSRSPRPPRCPRHDADLGSRLLGKGTVVASDTPTFIANRLGVHGMLVALRAALELGLGPDEVDALTGPLIGRPKSAPSAPWTSSESTCGGSDGSLLRRAHRRSAARRVRLPPLLRSLLERGALGEKSSAGFFRREAGEILALDFGTGEYRPRRRVASGTVDLARNEPDVARRIGILLDATDAASEFLRRVLGAGLTYAASVAAEIADDAWSLDAAMRWGFGWELGPLQLLDALGERRAALVEAAGTFPAAYCANGSRLDASRAASSWRSSHAPVRSTSRLPGGEPPSSPTTTPPRSSSSATGSWAWSSTGS